MQARHQPGGTQTRPPVALIDFTENAGIRIGLQDRRLDALNTPTLLIDQNRRVWPPDGVAHGGDEIGDLLRLADIAPEQDEAPGLFIAVKGNLVGGQRKPAASEDHSFAIGHDVTLSGKIGVRVRRLRHRDCENRPITSPPSSSGLIRGFIAPGCGSSGQARG
ncbi:hypothetical protein D3C72_940130 [compost metagenome]